MGLSEGDLWIGGKGLAREIFVGKGLARDTFEGRGMAKEILGGKGLARRPLEEGT